MVWDANQSIVKRAIPEPGDGVPGMCHCTMVQIHRPRTKRGCRTGQPTNSGGLPLPDGKDNDVQKF